MKKNLLDNNCSLEIINRVKKLNEVSTGKWGNLSLNGMLCHCKIVNLAILEGKAADKTPSLKQRLIKTMILYVIQRIPKGIKTSREYLQEEQKDTQFETERNNVINTISRIAGCKDSLASAHPFFGKLDTEEWGRFAWLHMDHHLRQFGV